MEKFSAFRDPGTGIQPFLTPVPPGGSEILGSVLRPIGYLVGALRIVVVSGLALLHTIFVPGLFSLLLPIPFLHRVASQILTAVISRLVLLIIGVWWIPVEAVTRKKGRGIKASESWNPGAGDLIVSNWASWIEILWLAFRFNPIFVLPVCETLDLEREHRRGSAPIVSTPGRRTGTGSAAIPSAISRAPIPRAKVLGFRRVSLLSMIQCTGTTPVSSSTSDYTSLEDIRSKADRPVVVFPEGTTSNGRGLLRFSDVFSSVSVPVQGYQVYIMCVRYDPPTALKPTLSHSITSSVLNPLPHIFTAASCLFPLTVSIRLLAPSESPSSPSFLPSDFVSGLRTDDILTECCAALIAQAGRMKRVGLGWEDKAAFLGFYEGKK